MVLIPAWRRPSEGTSIGNHEARIRKLERAIRGNGWIFNFPNTGGWGYLLFLDSFDLDLQTDPLSQGGDWGGAIVDDSGDGLLIGSTTLLKLLSDGDLSIGANGELLIKLGALKSITVRDSNNDPVLQMTDGSPDLHLPTGGNVIFDL